MDLLVLVVFLVDLDFLLFFPRSCTTSSTLSSPSATSKNTFTPSLTSSTNFFSGKLFTKIIGSIFVSSLIRGAFPLSIFDDSVPQNMHNNTIAERICFFIPNPIFELNSLYTQHLILSSDRFSDKAYFFVCNLVKQANRNTIQR